MSSTRHAPAFTYSIANRQALAVLDQISACLRSYKRHRAELVLARYRELTPRNGRYSPAMRAARRKFEDTFAAISVRGRGRLPEGMFRDG